MLRLLRTTSFRFTIVYVLVFAVSVALLGALFYQATFAVVSKQTDMMIDQDMDVLAELFAAEGGGALVRVMKDRAAWRDDGLYLLLNAPSGALLAGNLTALPPEALRANDQFFNFTFERTRVDGAGREIGVEPREARGKIRRFRASPDAETSLLVFIARDISGREALRNQSRGQITRIAIATILLGLVIGLIFSRSLLRRVDSVNRTARAIRDGDLSRRIALTGAGDELENLAINLNAMLDQIERLMNGMREVSDNIAHDLRSPLTRIKGRLADALKGDDVARAEALRATLEDSERMLSTFNALLSIARIESGEAAGAMEPVDLAAIVAELAELYEPAAQDAGFSLEVKTQPAPPVWGSRELISQAVANLLDNALKYAEGGSTIGIAVRRSRDDRVQLCVRDDGPGVPVGEREHVLKRFVRLEASRTSPGSGLGLSLVAAIARAHGATLSLGDAISSPAPRGLSVTLGFRTADSKMAVAAKAARELAAQAH